MEYEGVVASTYDLLVPQDLGDVEFFRRAIVEGGEPALEIGCGTGRLLLPYLQAGLDVDGVDSSAEMLRICRRKAEERRLQPRLYQQFMQSLDLARRYRTLYVPACSLMLLTWIEDAKNALERFHRHLAPGGRLIVPLFLPWKTDVAAEAAPPGEWRLRREHPTVRCWEQASYDFAAQIKSIRLRYELPDRTEELEMALRWYTQQQFGGMLREAGFGEIQTVRGYSAEPARMEDATFTFLARAP